jgi:hypothetical protein
MPQLPRSTRLLKKAEAALLSALELYNKPDFKYREETFSILMLNAWELLLKAKLLLDANNDLKSIQVYESRATKTGRPSKKQYLRRNRSGNAHTKSLGQVVVALDESAQSRLSPQVKANLDALQEVRDNAVHYFNASPQFAKQVLEIGTASVKNFVALARQWFSHDLSEYSLYLLPIGFISPPGTAAAIHASPDEARILSFLQELIRSTDSPSDQDFHVGLAVDLTLRRSAPGTLGAVSISTGPPAPGALQVTLSDEDVRKAFPWDYKALLRRLRERYTNFKATSAFYTIRKPLLADPRLVRTRFLDPGNPKSGKKDFYNPNILSEFDNHYTRKS